MKCSASDYLVKDHGPPHTSTLLPSLIELVNRNPRDGANAEDASRRHGKHSSTAFTSPTTTPRIIYVNNAFMKTYGYAKEEIIGRPSGSLVERDNRTGTRTPNSGEEDALHKQEKDGTTFPAPPIKVRHQVIPKAPR